jgi:predicted ATPase
MSQTLYKTMKDRTKKERIEQIWQRMASLRKQQMDRIQNQARELWQANQKIEVQGWAIILLRVCFALSSFGLIASILWRMK